MSFKPTILDILNDFSILKQQIALTSENWNDSVQMKFYKQFLNPLPREFSNYVKSLENLDKVFESAERTIDELLNNKNE